MEIRVAAMRKDGGHPGAHRIPFHNGAVADANPGHVGNGIQWTGLEDAGFDPQVSRPDLSEEWRRGEKRKAPGDSKSSWQHHPSGLRLSRIGDLMRRYTAGARNRLHSAAGSGKYVEILRGRIGESDRINTFEKYRHGMPVLSQKRTPPLVRALLPERRLLPVSSPPMAAPQVQSPVIEPSETEDLVRLARVDELAGRVDEAIRDYSAALVMISEKTSITAQVVGIADVLDALTTDRSYRQASSVGEAVEEMTRRRGWWRPVVLEAFVRGFA